MPETTVVDLDVRVAREGDKFQAIVNDGQCEFTLPLAAADVDGFAAMLQAARSRDFRPVVSESVGDPYAEAKRLGERLFDAVFQGDTRDELIKAWTAAATDDDKRVRVRLQLELVPELVNLPWELLFYRKKHIVLADQPYLVRHGGVDESPRAIAVDGALRILALTSSPSDLGRLNIEAEYAGLKKELDDLITAGRVHLEQLPQPTFQRLHETLMAAPWHIVHFIGHGDRGPGGGFLALCTESGTREDVRAEALGQLLSGSPELRLVVLNACSTAVGPNDHPLSAVAYELMQYGAPATIAMQFPVSDGQAICFAQAFYAALASGKIVDSAIAEARKAMLQTPEWVTPVYFLRASGDLFDIPVAEIATPPALSITPAACVPPDLLPEGERTSPRSWIVEELIRWIDGPQQLFLLGGVLGMGKSVLCGWLAGGVADTAGAPQPIDHVRSQVKAVHFFSASFRGASTDPRAFVLSVSKQLAASVPGFVVTTSSAVGTIDDLLSEVSGLDDLFERGLARPLRAAAPSEPILVIVDGIDEAAAGAGPTVVDLLSRLAQLDVPLKLLITSADNEHLSSFGRFGPQRVTRIDLSSSERRAQVIDDVRAFIDARLTASGADPAAPVVRRFVRRLAEAADGNFLYAGFLTASGVEVGDGELPLPDDLSQLYELRLEALLQQEFGAPWRDGWVKDVEPLVGLLAVSEAPVPEAALESWLDWTKPQTLALCSRFEQIIRPDDDRFVLSHPAFAQFLLATAPRARQHQFVIDSAAAHRRVVTTTFAWIDADLTRARFEGGSYSLVHLVSHVRALIDSGIGIGEAGDWVARLVTRVTDPSYLAALRSCVNDPVLVGKPYRDLTDLLLGRGRGGDVERIIACLATSDDPAIRQGVFDILLAWAERDENAAAKTITGLALHDDVTLADVALRATCTLSVGTQASVFRDVVMKGDDDRRTAAAYALYANGLGRDTAVIGDVLREVVGDLSLRHPLAMRRPLEFFVQVTVTNYINNCSSPDVAQLTSDLFRQLLVDRLHLTVLKIKPVAFGAVVVMANQLSKRVLAVATGAGDDGAEPIGAQVPGADAARRVVAALDPAFELATAEADVGAMLDSDIPLFRILGALVIGVHDVQSVDTTAAIVSRLFAGGSARRRLWLLLAHAVVLPSTPAAWIEPLETMTRDLAASGQLPDAAEETVLEGIDFFFAPLGFAYAKAGRPMAEHERLLASTEAADVTLRARCLHGIGVTGLYFPDQSLAELDRLVGTDVVRLDEVVAPLALMAGLHPLRVRAWAEQQLDRSLPNKVTTATDLAATRRYLEKLGHFNNAVHLALAHPQMRRRVGMTVFTFFLDSSSRKEWSKRYAREGVTFLRDADFELIRWTEPG